MTVDHNPGAFVGYLQPKGDHYVSARATNELRIRDGKLRNESEAFAPGVVALVVRERALEKDDLIDESLRNARAANEKLAGIQAESDKVLL